MAGAAAGLIATRAALLLRCQAAREERRRVAAASAARIRTAAADALAAAGATLASFELERQDAMRRTYDGLAGRKVDAAALHDMPAQQALQLRTRAGLANAAETAAGRLREATDAERVALTALACAARRRQRREQLSELTAQRHRAVLALAEESEREDATTDAWRQPP